MTLIYSSEVSSNLPTSADLEGRGSGFRTSLEFPKHVFFSWDEYLKFVQIDTLSRSTVTLLYYLNEVKHMFNYFI